MKKYNVNHSLESNKYSTEKLFQSNLTAWLEFKDIIFYLLLVSLFWQIINKPNMIRQYLIRLHIIQQHTLLYQ